MSRIKEALSRIRSSRHEYPGLLDLHMAMVPLLLAMAEKMVITIPRRIPVSRVKTPNPDGYVRERTDSGITITVKKKEVIAVTLGRDEFVIQDKGTKGVVMHGGKTKDNGRSGFFYGRT